VSARTTPHVSPCVAMGQRPATRSDSRRSRVRPDAERTRPRNETAPLLGRRSGNALAVRDDAVKAPTPCATQRRVCQRPECEAGARTPGRNSVANASCARRCEGRSAVNMRVEWRCMSAARACGPVTQCRDLARRARTLRHAPVCAHARTMVIRHGRCLRVGAPGARSQSRRSTPADAGRHRGARAPGVLTAALDRPSVRCRARRGGLCGAGFGPAAPKPPPRRRTDRPARLAVVTAYGGHHPRRGQRATKPPRSRPYPRCCTATICA
jgi:hypothetical protein